MAIYDGQKAAQEHLLEVAKACVIAAAKAPTLTGGLDLKTEIITDEDLVPMIEVMEALGKGSEVLEQDSRTYRKLLDEGDLPPVLLIGADLTKAIGWDCGGCGFTTCGEFTNYLKKNKGLGIVASGPSCLWKVMDFGIACDHACACAYMHRVEARIQFSMGSMCTLMGHLEGCSCVLALPLGPLGADIWFDRQSMIGALDYEELIKRVNAVSPNLRMAFTGGGNPLLKTKDRWWEDPVFLKIGGDPELLVRRQESMKQAMEKIGKYRAARSKRKGS
jgi:uncharacterized ferredoxin-like protein